MPPHLDSLLGTLEALATGTYTVTRRGADVMVKGRLQPGPAETLEVRAVVAPLGGRDLLRLPEGQRAQERRLFLCPERLQTGGSPDTVTIDGEAWEVESVEDWSQLAGFFRCVVLKAGD